MNPPLTTLCVVGYGYWGPKLVRNFRRHCRVMVCDSSTAALDRARADFPGIMVCSDYKAVWQDPGVDAVAIATPVSTHLMMAALALNEGKHVLVEKPLTDTLEGAQELVKMARWGKRVLMVDHTFLYHPAIRHLKAMVDSDEFGRLDYIDSTRINLGLFQPDVNVLWDLAVHDVAIALHLCPERPKSVQAIGACHGGSSRANIGSLFLRYDSGLYVHSSVSWVSPVKIRSMILGGSKKMALYNDLNVSEPVKIYDAGFTLDQEKAVEYRIGDTLAPKISSREALADMACDFVSSINLGHSPISSGEFGLEVVRVLEAAQYSLEAGGKEMKL